MAQLNIQWLIDATHDLQVLRRYIAQENSQAATQIAKHIIVSIERLATQPATGRPGRVPDTRELIVSGTSYIIDSFHIGRARQIHSRHIA